MTRILGAVLAGGAARRFGSDKAMATVAGAPMIRHILATLGRQADALLVCGRDMAGVPSVADRPGPGLGPLAGLAAALHYGEAHGFDAVLSVPCDTLDLPGDLRAQLGEILPAYVADQPVIGVWPCALADALARHLVSNARSMRGWADRIGAVAVTLSAPLANINTPSDLARWQGRHG